MTLDEAKQFFASLGPSVEEGIRNFALFASANAAALAKLYQQYLEDSVRGGTQALSDYIKNVVKAIDAFLTQLCEHN